jgi:hypothetical protein
MSLRSNPSIRAISGAALATVITLSFGACAPVKLTDDTDSTGSTGASGSAGEDGNSSGGSGGAETGDEGGETVPTACVDLEPRVLGVLETKCAKCHGPGSAAQGGIDYIINLAELIAQNKVVPGDAATSRIYARMVAAMNPMPPATEEQRPTELDKDIVEAWIDQCAGVQSCADQSFISRDEVLLLINQDLGSVNLEAKPFTRYFSFVHLHNAGFCSAEIDVYRESLAKLVNSLSLGTQIKAPVAIDELKLIYRIDIGDYEWQRGEGEFVKLSEPTVYFRDGDNENISPEEKKELDKKFTDVWEMMVDQNPYAVEYIGDVATSIKEETKTNFPILQGDAFIDVSSRSPLYYDILNIPRRSAKLRPQDADCGPAGSADECLETQLAVEVLKNIEEEFLNNDDVVGRAGFKKSDVSDFNRVVERHLFKNANNRTFWISYDFAGQSGKQNITVNPLDFDFDGGEIIFTLPNGMQGYMLTDAAGTRLNEGPLNIVQDESQKDFIVRNGVSCMGCHSAGMIKVQDDIRYALDANMSETSFDAIERDKIRDLYPRREDFDGLVAEDIRRFNDSLALAGVTVGAEKEPVITSFLAFDENVTLRRAGAEYDLSEKDMVQAVGKLGDDLNDLAEGNTIQRRDFTNNFPAGVCILNIGCSRFCPGVGDNAADRACIDIDIDGDGEIDKL